MDRDLSEMEWGEVCRHSCCLLWMRILIENSPPHLKMLYSFFVLHLKARFLAYVVCSVAQSCLILCYPTDCSLPVSSVHGIFEARILEWVTISYSRVSSQPKYQAHISWISCFVKWILYHCATCEAPMWVGIKENKVIPCKRKTYRRSLWHASTPF